MNYVDRNVFGVHDCTKCTSRWRSRALWEIFIISFDNLKNENNFNEFLKNLKLTFFKVFYLNKVECETGS